MASAALTPPEPRLEPFGAEDEVFRWRREQFRQLGLNEFQATELAASDADLGQARYLLGSGCPPQLALQILL
jgi:alpha-tubulin suppressor-like RCC1 family protein